jgi:hypothetical protein
VWEVKKLEAAKKAPAGFSDEERRLRMRMIQMGVRQKNIASDTGIHINDISNVIRGRSRSPRYVAEVYRYLELEQPETVGRDTE